MLLARIDAVDGNAPAARAKLSALLEEACHDTERAELQYWLWKLGGKDEG